MNKRIARLLRTNITIFSLCLVLFALAAIPFDVRLAIGEGVAAVAFFLLGRRRSKATQQSLRQYIQRFYGGMDSARSSNMLFTPLPMMVFDLATEDILWSSESFLQLTEQREGIFDAHLETVFPNISFHWLLEGKTEAPETVVWNHRTYRVFGGVSHPEGGQSALATTYWMDVTDTEEMRRTLELTRPVVAILMVDNYEDLMKATPEGKRSAVRAMLEEKLSQWSAGAEGMMLKYDRDRYLFVFEEKSFSDFAAKRFDVLDAVREVVAGEGVAATLSIGVGRDADSFEALFKNASVALEMALSRGGDQAVVKDKLNFEFYGGRSKATEKRTKVKSRVMANALAELIDEAKQVYVMGHSYADMDALGAAAGVCAIVRKRGKKCRIVIDTENNAAHPVLRRLQALPEYQGAFLSGDDAFLRVQPETLLVVVDTNRPGSVESEPLLEPGGGHRPPPPGQQLHRQDGPELPRTLRLLSVGAGDGAAPVPHRARRPVEGGVRGAAGRHRAGHQEFHQPHRRPHLRGGSVPAPGRGGYGGRAADVPERPPVHDLPLRYHPPGGALPRRHRHCGAGSGVRPGHCRQGRR